MKYIINYTEQGKIIGFYNENQPSNLNLQVDNQTWFNNMGMTKIIIDKDKNITFEKVDWKTPEEIEQETQSQFRDNRDKLLVEADIEINKLVDAELDVIEWRVYRQALRDSTLTWVLPSKPIGDN